MGGPVWLSREHHLEGWCGLVGGELLERIAIVLLKVPKGVVVLIFESFCLFEKLEVVYSLLKVVSAIFEVGVRLRG